MYKKLLKRIEELEARLKAVETKVEQRYVSDLTRQENAKKDAAEILSEYLFGEKKSSGGK